MVGLIVLEDVCVRWWWASCNAGVHWGLASKSSPSAFIDVCYPCISLSTVGQWALCAEVVCIGGCEGACLPGWISACWFFGV